MGDQAGYPDNFLDAMGQLWKVVKELGSPELVGIWPTEGYEFDASEGLFDESHFIACYHYTYSYVFCSLKGVFRTKKYAKKLEQTN